MLRLARLAIIGPSLKYTVSKANVDSSKNMLLLKNSQFLPNHSETLLKYGTHEYPILAKFRNDWVKIEDFFNKSIFLLESTLALLTVYTYRVLKQRVPILSYQIGYSSLTHPL